LRSMLSQSTSSSIQEGKNSISRELVTEAHQGS
jgi:hypothetical protein